MRPVIRLTDVSKCYRIVRQRPFLAKVLFKKLMRRADPPEVHWALRDISFEVGDGESVGVIGYNGSGKSTLLSLIARTSYPTSGTVEVQGRIGPLLELGAGFAPELTGLENIFLNASLLGLQREEVDAKLESIIEYAGIGDYVYSPLSTYSTGMGARLGFAVIAHIDPDILLIDEALAVGDSEFQGKCMVTMEGFKARGKTMFLVTHDMAMVQRICDRAIWIDRGRVLAIGPSDEVVAKYQESQPAEG
ncbi:MAG: ABC transporter ATP-binding protein [bacterium]|nr:ABC transporter ATP-binding protein [bacterium]